jgi:hypothetical protein
MLACDPRRLLLDDHNEVGHGTIPNRYGVC